jgi:hypothetical protein
LALKDDDNDFVSEWRKGNALIRSQLGLNPEKLQEEEWAQYYNEALWLKEMDAKIQAELMKKIFGD